MAIPSHSEELAASDPQFGLLSKFQTLIRPYQVDETPANVWAFFIDRVRDNLHVVLCFSPVGEKFRNRSRKFPGLISGCNIDWFSSWPREALMSVAQQFLSDFKISCTDEVKRALVENMAFIHHCVNLKVGSPSAAR